MVVGAFSDPKSVAGGAILYLERWLVLRCFNGIQYTNVDNLQYLSGSHKFTDPVNPFVDQHHDTQSYLEQGTHRDWGGG